MRYFLGIWCFTHFCCQAQNLVPNPSFESVNTCAVSNLYQGSQAINSWFTKDYSVNSPDIFNTCFTEPSFRPPSTFAGYSYARSGNSMAGVGCFISNNYREVISVKLPTTLELDSAYCVEFYVKNSKSDNVISWSQNLSLYFSEDSINPIDQPNIEGDIVSTERLDDNSWIKISGYLISAGNENYINIGFFGNHDTYHPKAAPVDFIYYFLDDVSVTKCSKDSILAVFLDLPNVITPNNDGVNDLYTIKSRNIKQMNITILNRWGNTVLEYDGLKTIWDGKDSNGNELNDGVYFVVVNAESNFGEVFFKQQFVELFR